MSEDKNVLYSSTRHGLASFSFRIEESFIGEILDCEGRSHVCKIYVDSYRKILNEKTDEVDASMKRFTTFIIGF